MSFPWSIGGSPSNPGNGSTVTGAEFLSGLGPPDSALGKNGDTYLDYTPGVGIIHKKAGNGWAPTPGRVIGAPGTPGSNGAPGANGAPGVGIASTTIQGGHLIITYSTGAQVDLGVVVGQDGVGGGGTAYQPDGTAPVSVPVPSPTTPTSLTSSAVAVLIYVTGGDVYVAFDSTTPTTSSTRWQAGETYEVSPNADVIALRFIQASGTPVLKVQNEVAA